MSNKIPEGYEWNMTHPLNAQHKSYDEFKTLGWNNAGLIAHEYLTPMAPPPAAPTKPTVADAWDYFEGRWPRPAPVDQVDLYWDLYKSIYWCFEQGFIESNLESPSYEFNRIHKVCTREEFEQYGRNRVWRDEKTAKAMCTRDDVIKDLAARTGVPITKLSEADDPISHPKTLDAGELQSLLDAAVKIMACTKCDNVLNQTVLVFDTLVAQYRKHKTGVNNG